MSRFTNDVDTVGEMLNTTLIQIISGVITTVGTIILMLYTSPILGTITIIATPILACLSKTIMTKGSRAYREQQRSLGMLNGFTEEMLSGQKVVQVFHHEDIAMDEFAYLNQKLCRSQEQAQFRAGIMGPVTHQLCNAIYAVVACVGSTGAGKTTVTDLLSRFYDIQDGTITIDGIPIEKIDRSFLRSNIAIVLQDTHLFTGTVRENIRYRRLNATDKEVEQAARLASAHSFIEQLENGYDTMLEKELLAANGRYADLYHEIVELEYSKIIRCKH